MRWWPWTPELLWSWWLDSSLCRLSMIELVLNAPWCLCCRGYSHLPKEIDYGRYTSVVNLVEWVQWNDNSIGTESVGHSEWGSQCTSDVYMIDRWNATLDRLQEMYSYTPWIIVVFSRCRSYRGALARLLFSGRYLTGPLIKLPRG